MGKNPLNDRDIDGNTMSWMMEKDQERDLYHCPVCEEDVTEDEFNHKRNQCYDCWWSIKEKKNDK